MKERRDIYFATYRRKIGLHTCFNSIMKNRKGLNLDRSTYHGWTRQSQYQASYFYF